MPRNSTAKAPKGRNKTAQGSALGNAAPGNQSPVGAAQISRASRHSGWRNTTLGTVITSIDTGKSFRCEERPPIASEVGVVKVSAVTWGTYDEEESKTCLDAARIEPRYLIEEGDFLFSRANTIQLIGACVIAGATSRRLMLSDKILRFRFTDEVEPKWVLHWLRSKQGRSEIERLSSGNQESMRNIGQERIRAIALPLPPPDDQRRIVAELEKQFTRLEAGVAALRRVQANLKRYRSSVLNEAASVSWPLMMLSEISEVITGSTPSKERPEYYGGALPFIKPGDLNVGYRVENAREHLSEEGAREARILPPNTVLVTCIGATIGKSGLVRVPCATNQQINSIIPHDHMVLPEWIYWMISSPFGQEQIKAKASATTLPILNKGKFSTITLPIPPLAEQAAIAADIERRLSVADALERTVHDSFYRSERFRQSILRAAFDGEL